MSTRLPGAKYRSVFDSGRVLKGRLMSAWVVRKPDAGRQAGVVVSKKSFHDAVDRNRAKRIMREAFRLSVDQVPGKPSGRLERNREKTTSGSEHSNF